MDEARIREIIREELRALMLAIAKDSDDLDGYETGELESSALGAIKKVAEREVETLQHAWGCPSRESSWNSCGCGGKDTFYDVRHEKGWMVFRGTGEEVVRWLLGGKGDDRKYFIVWKDNTSWTPSAFMDRLK